MLKKTPRIDTEFPRTIIFGTSCLLDIRTIPVYVLFNHSASRSEVGQLLGRRISDGSFENTNRTPKQALQYRPKGRRNIGRPKKRWRDQLHFEAQGTRKHA